MRLESQRGLHPASPRDGSVGDRSVIVGSEASAQREDYGDQPGEITDLIRTDAISICEVCMAKKAKRSPPPRDDEELKERIREAAPEVLKATAPEGWFEMLTDRLLQQSRLAENTHFYCRSCGEYHLKTHPHCRAK